MELNIMPHIVFVSKCNKYESKFIYYIQCMQRCNTVKLCTLFNLTSPNIIFTLPFLQEISGKFPAKSGLIPTLLKFNVHIFTNLIEYANSPQTLTFQ
jgi:hypothetical protein